MEVLGVLASLAKRIADRFNADTVHQSFGFVAQRVERHVEGVSVAVSKSAEATNNGTRIDASRMHARQVAFSSRKSHLHDSVGGHDYSGSGQVCLRVA